MLSWLRRGAGWQESERAYLLWKARQVADQQGSGAVAVEGGHEGKEGEAKKALVELVIGELKGDLFPELVGYTGFGRDISRWPRWWASERGLKKSTCVVA
jgi:hypothetical protein